jgi:hypothetical protein
MDSESTPSSQATVRPSSSSTSGSKKVKTAKPGKIIHAIGSNKHISGKTTPVLLRDHIHANDPDTPPLSPPPSEESKRTNGETELNFDLQELGLEDTVIRPDLLQKLERIGSGGFKEWVQLLMWVSELIVVSMLGNIEDEKSPFQNLENISARVSFPALSGS